MNNNNMNKLLALFTVFVTLLGMSYGKTIYVNANFPTAGNGTDWSSPYTNLQSAVAASVAGDLVLVTNGVYSPITTGNKAITIQSVNGHSDTIIDGGGVSRCATLGTGVVLRGFLLKNGYVSGYGGGVAFGSLYDSVVSNNLATTYGGGVYNSAIVSNCVVVGNIAMSTVAWEGGGGTYNCTTVMDSLISGNIATNGVYTKGGGSYGGTLYRCRVENNLGKEGSGVANSHVYDSVICGNESFVNDGRGGGYFAGNTTYNVSNCVISSNSAPHGGGAWNGTLRNCIVSNNVATVTDGGGVRGAVVYDSLIVNNSAKSNGGGVNGGTLTGCTISGNTANRDGGGVHGGTLTGCTISGNTANARGGGVSSATICTDSDIFGNQSSGTGYVGGGSAHTPLYRCRIYGNIATNGCGGGVIYGSLFSCIVSNNIAIRGGGAAMCYDANNSLIIRNRGGGTYYGLYRNCVIAYNSITKVPGIAGSWNGTYQNCIVSGNTNVVSGTVLNYAPQDVYAFSSTVPLITGYGNIDSDPQFTDPANNDFTLLPTSPCINKGANQYVTTATDFVGRPRIKDWRVDMGAYENQSQRFAVTPNPLYPLGTKDVPEWTPIPALAWYKLDGNALDSSGNGYHGTWSGTEAYAAGKFAGTQAGAFDSTNVVSRATDIGITQGFTLTAWVRSSGLVDSYPRIAGSENKWGLFLSSALPLGVLRFLGSGDPLFPKSDATLFDGAWHHVACVYAGNGIDGYIDGASVGTIAKTGDLTAQAGTPITIGNRADGTRGLNGNVQDVRIFNRALSQANIQRIMESQDNEPLEELQ